LKSAGLNAPVFRACARRRSQRQAFLDFAKPHLRCVNSMTDLRGRSARGPPGTSVRAAFRRTAADCRTVEVRPY
jgi:hypothetical protein